MLLENNQKQINRLLFLFSLLLFAYTFIRAYLLSITWDEGYSYFEFIRHGIYMEDKPGEMSANNHWLNTWLCIKLINKFGASELVLRIPSLIAHIIFLFSSAKLVSRFSNIWFILSSFLIINCNPYVLDFFSLSRGYALSISLMLLSVYYLVNYLKESTKIKYAVFSILAGALAILANFVLLNYFVVLFLLISFLLVVNFIKRKELRGKYAMQFIIIENLVLIILLLIVPTILRYREAGAFFYGAENSFWTDTVCSSIVSCFYGFNYPEWVQYLLKTILLITIGLAILYVFIRLRKKQITLETKIIFALLFLIGITALAFVVQHHFLHSLYLIDRTTQFYIVLFNVLLVYIANVVFTNKKVIIVINAFLLGLTLFHFIHSFNFSYVWEWKSNYCIKQMMKDLEEEKAKHPEKKLISVGTPLAYEMGINFYRVTRNLYWLNTPDRIEQTSKLRDYWFLEKDSAIANKKNYKLLNNYELTQSAFVKPINVPTIKKLVLRNTLDYSFSDNDGIYMLGPDIEYSPGFVIPVTDSLLNNGDLAIYVKYKIKVPYWNINKTSLIISIDNNGQGYVWKNTTIKEHIIKKDDWNIIEAYCPVPKEIKRGDVIKSYIWNKSTKNIFIHKAEIQLLEYSYPKKENDKKAIDNNSGI